MKDKITSLAWVDFACSKSVCKYISVAATAPDHEHLSMDIAQNKK